WGKKIPQRLSRRFWVPPLWLGGRGSVLDHEQAVGHFRSSGLRTNERQQLGRCASLQQHRRRIERPYLSCSDTPIPNSASVGCWMMHSPLFGKTGPFARW